MRRSTVFALTLLLLTATSAAAQYSIGATAEVVVPLTVTPAQIEVSASGAGVLVSERAAERRGTLTLEQTYVSAAAATATQRMVWVRDARGLHQERVSGWRLDEAAGVALGRSGVLRSVDVKLGTGRSVLVTKVVATNS